MPTPSSPESGGQPNGARKSLYVPLTGLVAIHHPDFYHHAQQDGKSVPLYHPATGAFKYGRPNLIFAAKSYGADTYEVNTNRNNHSDVPTWQVPDLYQDGHEFVAVSGQVDRARAFWDICDEIVGQGVQIVLIGENVDLALARNSDYAIREARYNLYADVTERPGVALAGTVDEVTFSYTHPREN